jgi:hypothetical protein
MTSASDAVTSPVTTDTRGDALFAVSVTAGALVLLRSVTFAFAPQSFFDADQAVMGLMAKHLSEGRAFPLFMYGQNYILAVEAWMAAPLFLVGGPSVALLKLPLVAINVAAACLLVRVLVRDGGLRPWLALVASMFFVMPPPGTAAQLVEASGGNLEPFLYIVLLWMARGRGLVFGAVLAIGFLQREFTAYAIVAFFVVWLVQGPPWRVPPAARVTILRAALAFAVVWGIVAALRPYASAAGPGTSIADVAAPASNLGELAARFCGDLLAMLRAAPALYREYLAYLFGLRVQPVSDFAVNSGVVQGMPGLWALFGGLVAVSLLAIAPAARGAPTRQRAPIVWYLGVTGMAAIVFYAWGRCGELSIQTLRYGLLGILAMVALTAAALHTARPSVRPAIVALVVAWSAASVVAHIRIADEYVRHPPPDWRGILAGYLTERGVRYAESDYWTAYHVTFLSGERVIVGTRDVPRVLTYQRLLDAHRAETWTIGRERCAAGLQVIPRWWVCPPAAAAAAGSGRRQ